MFRMLKSSVYLFSETLRRRCELTFEYKESYIVQLGGIFISQNPSHLREYDAMISFFLFKGSHLRLRIE